jgi:hypothetical protein
MLSDEERKLARTALVQLNQIRDDMEFMGDVIVEAIMTLSRAQGPHGTLNNVTRAVVRQKAQAIVNHLANAMNTANSILEEF